MRADEPVPEQDDGQQLYDLAAGLAAMTRRDEDTHMKIGQMMESKYMKRSDVEGETPVTVHALKKVNVARDDEDPEYRWTVKFAEFEKPMVLNATNIKRMGKVCGDDTDDWIGQTVVLYVDENVEYGGDIVGGLRIRGSTRKASTGGKPNDDDVNRKLAAAADDAAPF